MSDSFRGRSSTWSAGSTSYSKDDPSAGLNDEYKLSYPFASKISGYPDDNSSLRFQELSDIRSPKMGLHYSPASSSTANDLGSQEFHPRSHFFDKTPDSDYVSPHSSLFTVLATSESSPSRSLRDWNTPFSLSSIRGQGIQGSSSSSTFPGLSNISLYGRSDGLGLGSAYSSSSPYPVSNGAGYPDGTAKKLYPSVGSAHPSGSPSSAGSQVSLAPISGSGSNSAKRPARKNPWGPETYSDLIANAIESYPEKQATLQQIYDYISRNYTYFRERSDPPASAGWKNSIRHNLSLHDKFVKCPKASESAKSSHWRLNSSSPNRSYVRRRACSMETGNMKKAKARVSAMALSLNAKRNVLAQARKLPNGVSMSQAASQDANCHGKSWATSWDSAPTSAPTSERLSEMPAGHPSGSAGARLSAFSAANAVGVGKPSTSGRQVVSTDTSNGSLNIPGSSSLTASLFQPVGGGGQKNLSLSNGASASSHLNLLITNSNHNAAAMAAAAASHSWYNARKHSDEIRQLRQNEFTNFLSSFDTEKTRSWLSDELTSQTSDTRNPPSATDFSSPFFPQHFTGACDFRSPHHSFRYPLSHMAHQQQAQQQQQQAPPPPPPYPEGQSSELAELRSTIAYSTDDMHDSMSSPDRSRVSGVGGASYRGDVGMDVSGPTVNSAQPSSYSLSGILADSNVENMDIPERFLRSSNAETCTGSGDEATSSSVTQQQQQSSHLHNLTTTDPTSSRTSYSPCTGRSTGQVYDGIQSTDSYIESLELQLSLQVANRVVGSCLPSSANDLNVPTTSEGPADMHHSKMHWPRTVENGVN